MTVSSTRSEVRSTGRRARKGVLGAERATAELALVSHLQSLEDLKAPSVGVFIAHDGEPNLTSLGKWLWDRGSVVALPVLEDDPDDFSMRFVPWHQGDALGTGRYGIPVPPPAPAIAPATLLVSFTGFDALGNRMGRGAGFFDRYLSTYAGNVVGVGFEVQRFDRVPTEPHDQPLATVATDLGVRFIQ